MRGRYGVSPCVYTVGRLGGVAWAVFLLFPPVAGHSNEARWALLQAGGQVAVLRPCPD